MSQQPFYAGASTLYHQEVGRFDISAAEAWAQAGCWNCGGTQMGVVAFIGSAVKYLRCVNCARAAVWEWGRVSPAPQPLRLPAGVPPIEEAVWSEIRMCLGVGAHTAAVMLCRKLLLHVAVTKGLAETNDKGRAPNFMEAVDHLEEEGLITKKMRPWVNRIKDVGNEANHEIQPVQRDVAFDVATFTEQLLILAYELDALMAQRAETTEQ